MAAVRVPASAPTPRPVSKGSRRRSAQTCMPGPSTPGRGGQSPMKGVRRPPPPRSQEERRDGLAYSAGRCLGSPHLTHRKPAHRLHQDEAFMFQVHAAERGSGSLRPHAQRWR
jgi:hypothetical protein